MNESAEYGFRVRSGSGVRARLPLPSNERGSVSVVAALSMTGLLALLALGIDLGALFTARSEAQRAADAASLAGASAFLEYQDSQARRVAEERALEYATSNKIRGALITPEEVTVSVVLDSSIVRTSIRRNGVPTWFARLFGVDGVDVGAQAAAWAGNAGAARCVKPFAVPDLWHETTHDLNNNRIWDEGERWSYDPSSGDFYAPYTGLGGDPNATGYGSTWRDGHADAYGRTYERDYGRRITIKVSDPRDAYVPSFFLPWVLPLDRNQAQCGATPGGPGGPGGASGPGQGGPGGNVGDPGDGQGGGAGWFRWIERRGDLGGPGGPPRGGPPEGSPGGPPGSPPGGGSSGGVDRDSGEGRGAARYRQNICACNNSIIDLDTEYLIEPGNMVGPTYQGVQQLIQQDPDAYWDDRTNSLVSKYGMDSPRVITVALFHPGEITRPGRQHIRFNNFARFFIEEQASRHDPVTGRFLYYVPGVGRQGRDGETTGSLVRVLQLIQ